MMQSPFGLMLCLAMAVFSGSPSLARCADHVPQPKPQNVSRDIVGADLDTIQDRGWMEFAAYEDFPPWSFLKNGKPAGVDIEIGQMIAEELGVEARFNLVAAAENLDGDLLNWVWKGPVVGGRVANVMLHVPYDSELGCRIEQVVFTGQYHVEEIAIAFRRDVYPEAPPVPAYFRFDSVGVENDAIADFYLSGLLGAQAQENIHRFPDTAAAMDALDKGDVMAVMGPRAQLEHGLTNATDMHTPPLPGFAVGKWTVGVAVHFAYRPLAYSVDDAIVAGIGDGRIQKIFENYGLTFAPPELR